VHETWRAIYRKTARGLVFKNSAAWWQGELVRDFRRDGRTQTKIPVAVVCGGGDFIVRRAGDFCGGARGEKVEQQRDFAPLPASAPAR